MARCSCDIRACSSWRKSDEHRKYCLRRTGKRILNACAARERAVISPFLHGSGRVFGRRAVNLKPVLGKIETDRGNMLVDGSSQLWRSPTTTLWHIDAGSGGRPPHQDSRTSESLLVFRGGRLRGPCGAKDEFLLAATAAN